MSMIEAQRTGVTTVGATGALQKKETAGSGIESTGGRSIFSTRPGSGSSDGRSVRSDDTGHISVSVSSKRTNIAEQVSQSGELMAPSTTSTFAQRWSARLCKVLRVIAAVLAWVCLPVVNTVAIPLVYLTALCSRGLGDGSWAEFLGKSGLVRKLLGEDFAHRLATDEIPVLLMVASFVFPGLVPLQALWHSSQRAMELAEGRTIGFAERERAARVPSCYDEWTKDQGLDPRRYRFRGGEWQSA